MEDQEFFWSKDYIKIIEKNYKRIFKDIYEQVFIDKIFGSNDSFINREDFLKSISTSEDELPKAEWIFKPD